METQVFTRQELYDLVWSESMLSLSKKYKISDVGLRKICVRMNIPLPQNGHWQKIQFGRTVHKPQLPEDNCIDKKNTEITLELRSGIKEDTTKSQLTKLQEEIEDSIPLKLVVPEKLTNPDKLIVAAKVDLTSKESDHYIYKGTVSCSRNHLDIRVAQKNISRALRFMDTLIKAFNARGHTVHINDTNTYVNIEEHDFKILLRERMTKVKVKDTNWDRTEYHPTGILYFQLYSYPGKEWKDGKVPLEDQLSRIIARLELSGKEWAEMRAEQKKNKDILLEKKRIQEAFEKSREKEITDFKEALSKASRWHKSNNLRNYILEAEAKALANGSLTLEIKEWLEWARKKADWYDPFVEKEDELLSDVDKDTLIVRRKEKTSWW